MIISDTKKFIFIHIPKTGGMSIRDVLQQFATVGVWGHPQYPGVQKNKELWKHASAENVQKYIRRWNQYFKFAFVRNPWSWIISVYYYIKIDKTDPRHEYTNKLNFKDFLNWFYDWKPEQYPIRAGQLNYLADKDGHIIVDFVGKLENIKNDFRRVCNKIQINYDLKKLNTTNHKPYRQYYDDKTKGMVSLLFDQDIKTFGYSF